MKLCGERLMGYNQYKILHCQEFALYLDKYLE